VSHFDGQKELPIPKVIKNNEQNPHEYTEDELKRVAQFMDVLIEIDIKHTRLYRRLEDEPKGFPVPGEGRNCGLCDRHVWDEDGWFDKWGFKCMNCQDAINKCKIPGSLCGDYKHEKSIPDTDLAIKLGIKVATLRKYIRQGVIKARRIPNGPYMILRKDNPSLKEVLAGIVKR
jgi:hypothetical protein